MATLAELEKAIEIARSNGATDTSEVRVDDIGNVIEIRVDRIRIEIEFRYEEGADMQFIDVWLYDGYRKVGNSLFVTK